MQIYKLHTNTAKSNLHIIIDSQIILYKDTSFINKDIQI